MKTQEKNDATTLKDFQELEKMQKEYDQIIAFLEYEEAFTTDKRTQERICRKLQQLGIWSTQQEN